MTVAPQMAASEETNRTLRGDTAERMGTAVAEGMQGPMAGMHMGEGADGYQAGPGAEANTARAVEAACTWAVGGMGGSSCMAVLGRGGLPKGQCILAWWVARVCLAACVHQGAAWPSPRHRRRAAQAPPPAPAWGPQVWEHGRAHTLREAHLAVTRGRCATAAAAVVSTAACALRA